jgi:hypothetical protein
MSKTITLILFFIFYSLGSVGQHFHVNEYVWQNMQGKHAVFNLTDSIYCMPLPNKIMIPNSVFETIVKGSSAYEASADSFANKSISDSVKLFSYNRKMPIPNNVRNKKDEFIYCGVSAIIFRKEKLPIYCILFDTSGNFTEHACYRMYYTPKIGPFLVVRQTEEDYSGKYTNYRVVKARVHSKSISKDLLDALYKKCIGWNYWKE